MGHMTLTVAMAVVVLLPHLFLFSDPSTVHLQLSFLLLPTLDPYSSHVPPLTLDGCAAVHHLRDEVPVDGVAGHLDGVLRAFAVVLIARHAGRTANTHTVGTYVAESIFRGTEVGDAHQIGTVRSQNWRNERIVVTKDVDDDIPLLTVGVGYAVRDKDTDRLGRAGRSGRCGGNGSKNCGCVSLGGSEHAGASLP